MNDACIYIAGLFFYLKVLHTPVGHYNRQVIIPYMHHYTRHRGRLILTLLALTGHSLVILFRPCLLISVTVMVGGGLTSICNHACPSQ